MYRSKRGLAREARKTITRHAHGAVIELHADGVPETHKHWHYDLRRGRLNIYGGMLRYIDECVAQDKPHLARQVLSWLDWYVIESERPSTERVV